MRVRPLSFAIAQILAVSSSHGQIVVDSTEDNLTDDGECTLREALALTQGAGGTDCGTTDSQITFALNPYSTITLALGQLNISADVTISGANVPGLTVDAAQSSRHFQVSPFTTTTLSAMNLIRGSTPTVGGSIYNDYGTLTLQSVTLLNNTADVGGALANIKGVVNLYASSIAGNVAVTGGGGVLQDQGSLSLMASTVSGNIAPAGGGIFATGSGGSDNSIGLISSTLSSNTATGGGSTGGGIQMRRGVLRTSDSTVYDNVPTGISRYMGGTWYSDRSVISSSDTTLYNGESRGIPFEGIESGDNNYVDGEPRLGALGDNGGPTQTHVPAFDSPLVDAVDPADCGPATDQRGEPRPDNGRCDIGSVELQTIPAADLTVPVTESGSESMDLVGENAAALSVRSITFPLGTGMVTLELSPTDQTVTTALGIELTANESGLLQVDSNGAFESLRAGEVVTETLQYVIFDGRSELAGSIDVEITGENDPPVVGDASFSTLEDKPLIVSAGSGLLASASDPDAGDTLFISNPGSVPVGDPPGGTLTVQADGGFDFTPGTDGVGTAQHTFDVSDGITTDSGTLTLEVTPVNDAPGFTIASDPQFASGLPREESVSGFVTGSDPGGGADESTQIITYVVSIENDPMTVLGSVDIESSGILVAQLTGAVGSATVRVVAEDDGGVENGGIDASAAQFFTITVSESFDLTITKSADVDTATPGQTLIYQIVVTNAGPSDVLDALIEDVLPAELERALWICEGVSDGFCSPSSGMDDVLTTAVIPGGEAVIATVLVDVRSDTAEGTQITNVAQVSSQGAETDTGNNSAVEITAVGSLVFMDGFELTINGEEDIEALSRLLLESKNALGPIPRAVGSIIDQDARWIVQARRFDESVEYRLLRRGASRILVTPWEPVLQSR